VFDLIVTKTLILFSMCRPFLDNFIDLFNTDLKNVWMVDYHHIFCGSGNIFWEIEAANTFLLDLNI